ncbi:DNA replication/repair protein RecF [Pseudoteredinibacter isoporae]|uniref:DNA replication/repair protein RecF n=1 Tax=Pseudoteredinibacter isoporae TaxID=570281 RepID=UPI0014205202|nr:DNA replication/repair protein RecF [Pseudoteredinibacter isoporae]NHO85756.1 DNA replication/repair protein RecF [Pseudoteredinibacter isoporae]NIB25792.1 DNA replication/repair protein RecF [Pseudoteredinibacter isoporae]
MPLTRLKISNLRNLGAVTLHPSSSLNFIFGANGSGKTSLLEAIFFLGTGRSFRSHKVKPLINHNADSLILFAKLLSQDFEHSIGLERQGSSGAKTKIDGKAVYSASSLASLLPTLIIDAHSFDLIEGAPKERRSYLDWLVFHVKHSFHDCWKGYSKALKHRNSLLRRGRIEGFELRPWEQEMCSKAEQLALMRQECFDKLKLNLNEVISDFVPLEGISIDFYKGWDKEKTFQEQLEEGKERDAKLGYTWYGAQKADIKIKIEGHPAEQALSRGQQKLLVCALKISIGKTYSELTGKPCIYLVDDLPAELDGDNQKRLANWLSLIGAQVFVTAVEKQALLNAWPEAEKEQAAMFHVKHGLVEHTNQTL